MYGSLAAAHTSYKAVLFTTSHMRIRVRYCKSQENPYQYYKSRENPYQVPQVTRTAFEHAMKSKVRIIKLLSP